MRHAHAHWHSRINSHSHWHWHSHSQRDVSKTCKCSKERKGHVLRVLCQCCKTFGLVTLAHYHGHTHTHAHTRILSNVCVLCVSYLLCLQLVHSATRSKYHKLLKCQMANSLSQAQHASQLASQSLFAALPGLLTSLPNLRAGNDALIETKTCRRCSLQQSQQPRVPYVPSGAATERKRERERERKREILVNCNCTCHTCNWQVAKRQVIVVAAFAINLSLGN